MVVEQASKYVTTFVSRFSHVVAEERYIQDSTSGQKLPSGMMYYLPGQHRELVADFLLVKTVDTTGWLAFRDVFEVNGTAVRDRGDRLAKLFVESARHARRHEPRRSRRKAHATTSARGEPSTTRFFLWHSFRTPTARGSALLPQGT